MRWLRGLLGTALLWGTGWGGVTAIGAFVSGGWLAALTQGVLHFGVGAVAGGTFAGLLAVGERGRSLSQLSPVRVAIWGATGGTILAPLQWLIAPTLGVAWPGVLGAGLAVGSLALARRAALHEGEIDDALASDGFDPGRALGEADPLVDQLDRAVRVDQGVRVDRPVHPNEPVR